MSAARQAESPVPAAKGPDEDEWRDLAVVIHDLARRLKPRSMEMARVSALSPTSAEVLRVVVNHPGVSIQEISLQAVLQQSNASAAVRDLVGEGLVRKVADRSDGRRVSVTPTQRAITEGERIEAAWGQLYAGAVGALDEPTVENLRSAVLALHALDRQLAALDED